MTTKLPLFETPFETYQATKVIGEGGSGRVYEATNSSGNIFALKCLIPERVTSEKLKRFKNEIGFCQRQDHLNIVRIIDTGATAIKEVKCPFYIMERFAGTLRTHMKDMQPDGTLQAFSQILDGIEAAHLSGVWHRDLKPENVLWNDNGNKLVIADFGIAHFEEDEIYTAVETKIAARMANFQYSAPEQKIRGAQVDHRADIFSLGLILNELFTGEVPQGAGFKRIEEINASYGYLDDIVDVMIQQNPQNRPDTIEFIKKELIGQKNAFIALQRYDETKKKVISTSTPPVFDPLMITGFDYADGILTLELSNYVPPGWAQEFQRPQGGHTSVVGYGPERFHIHGNTASISIRNDENLIQRVVDHAKQYVSAANRGYIAQIQEHAAVEERQQRAELENKVAEAKLRKNILSRVKL